VQRDTFTRLTKLSGQWLQCQANGSNVCRVLRLDPFGVGPRRRPRATDVPGCPDVRMTLSHRHTLSLSLSLSLSPSLSLALSLRTHTFQRACLMAPMRCSEAYSRITARIPDVSWCCVQAFGIRVSGVGYHSRLEKCVF